MNSIEQKDKILHDNLWSLAWNLSWPIIIAMVLYGLNIVIDAVLVGLLISENALAAVAITYPVVSITMGIGSLIGVGAGSLLSIAIGEKDQKKQSELLGNVNVLSIVLSAIYLVFVFFMGKTLLEFMGAQGEILNLAHTYLQHTLFGAFFWVYGFSANMIVRAEGKMKLAAIIMGTGLVVNVLVSYFLIDVLKLGVAGAAWGANIGMLVYSVFGFYYFRSKNVSFPAQPLSLKYDQAILKAISSLGMASFIMVVMNLIQAIAVFKSVSRYGSALDMAVYGAAYRVYTLLLMPIAGFMRALQPVIGINFGAGKYDRTVNAYMIFVLLSTLFILPIWVLLIGYPETVLSSMISTESLNSQHYKDFQVLLWATPVVPFLFMTMSFYPSIGKGKPAVLLAIIRQIIFYVPAMLILPALYGISWIYLASSIIEYGVALIALIMIIGELRRLIQLKTKSDLQQT
ncbi:MATE family efflux transporter [Chryseobacterium sp. BIGb0232]|uniref:MATE family efflux transporter n=1 Tax=Chryseobacterium sp. BIGb0232 TaxID=2940598 RepID=UPI000F47EB93|nr:MATE family efflux transporter [Chryseobacterium sp. BIGb0232]MCS4300958.1 putative MATE family efflux protein [Chryseobacterium sp. BIGb0232]ROS20176.1 putative MATE family efflux protein [Chryseobacterium nakagawai]